MELMPFKRVDTYALYKLKRFRVLDNKFLARLHKGLPEWATHAVLQFGEPIKNEWRVTERIDKKYNMAVIILGGGGFDRIWGFRV